LSNSCSHNSYQLILKNSNITKTAPSVFDLSSDFPEYANQFDKDIIIKVPYNSNLSIFDKKIILIVDNGFHRPLNSLIEMLNLLLTSKLCAKTIHTRYITALRTNST
jgi:hypothetical protein